MHEVISSTKDKQEFWAWLNRQYPVHIKTYKSTTTGAIFNLTATEIVISYSPKPGGEYEYVFDITGPAGHSKIGEEFIATVRNEFDLSGEEAAVKISPEKITESSKYLFQKVGDSWNMRFGDEQTKIPDLKGFHYISTLLASPGLAIPCDRLIKSYDDPMEMIEIETYGDPIDKKKINKEDLNNLCSSNIA
jgi:hypothetical protein